MNTIRYATFLRGINIGPHKKVKMETLKKMFEDLGFLNVKTLLNSGNVIFESNEKSVATLKPKLEEALKKTFGFEINLILRTLDEIQKLITIDPFKDIIVTPETRLYATFLSEKPKSKFALPYESPEKDFKILTIINEVIFSVLTLSPTRKTPEAMSILEKEYGKNVTTRNWNTVRKLLL